MKRILTIGILIATALIPVHAAAAAGPHAAQAAARLSSGVLDRSQLGGNANACLVEVTGVTCFATEAELDAYFASLSPVVGDVVNTGASAASSLVHALSVCSSYVKLYSTASYGLPVVQFDIESSWINLSAYGFDNATSSYRIGDCAATFRDGSSGGGSTYTGPTGAGVSASSMVSGWDNRVSSIWIS